MQVPLVLASASPRRLELLKDLGWPFTVEPSRADELHDASIDPARLCEINAERKAAEVAERFRGSLVIGADTLVALGNEIFGKPRDLAEARATLLKFSGKQHQVITGVCLIHRDSGREEVFSEVTEVQFRTLSEQDIGTYLARVNVLDKAGAYAIQEEGDLIIESIDGSRSNVVGLPLEKLGAALSRWLGPRLRASDE